VALEPTEPLTEMSKRVSLESTGGRCVGLTTLPPSSGNYLEVLGASQRLLQRIYIYIYVCVCVYIYIYVCVYIYIYTNFKLMKYALGPQTLQGICVCLRVLLGMANVPFPQHD